MSILASSSTPRRSSTPPSAPPATCSQLIAPVPKTSAASAVPDAASSISAAAAATAPAAGKFSSTMTQSTSLHPPARGSGATSLSNVNAQQRLLNPPTFIHYKTMQFLVMDAPSDSNLNLYFSYFKKYGVTDIVRACDGTYNKESVETIGIKVHEMNFKDGDPPPATVVSSWLQLVTTKFQAVTRPTPDLGQTETFEPPTIAVHCVAGLGRAPVLVAIALIEAGMPNLEAVDFIRSRRRGALNVKQIHFLDSYKRKGRSKFQALIDASTPSSPHTPSMLAAPSPVQPGGRGEKGEKCCMM